MLSLPLELLDLLESFWVDVLHRFLGFLVLPGLLAGGASAAGRVGAVVGRGRGGEGGLGGDGAA